MPVLAPITLATDRLLLRPVEDGDAEAQFLIFSDPGVMRYFSSGPWAGIEQSHAAIVKSQAALRENEMLHLALVERASGVMVGSLKLYAFHDMNRRCDIGYALATAHQGKGYLSEAMQAVLAYGFTELNLHRIEADIDPRNTASAKLLQKMGFQKEGLLRERWIVEGEICDTEFYGLLRRDFESR